MAKTSDKLVLGVLVIALLGMSGVFITAGDFFSETDARQTALNVVPGQITEVELENDVYEVDVLSNGQEQEITIDKYGNVISVEEEEIDTPITGTPLELASAAALDHIGQGRVTDSEVGDEEGFYEIEITLDNGKEVDVHLDENFNVLSVED
jgi:uncharacterized membrane protein YkoI